MYPLLKSSSFRGSEPLGASPQSSNRQDMGHCDIHGVRRPIDTGHGRLTVSVGEHWYVGNMQCRTIKLARVRLFSHRFFRALSELSANEAIQLLTLLLPCTDNLRLHLKADHSVKLWLCATTQAWLDVNPGKERSLIMDVTVLERQLSRVRLARRLGSSSFRCCADCAQKEIRYALSNPHMLRANHSRPPRKWFTSMSSG